ncbi:ferredoxin reductase family protein [Pseudotabrizicola alkalilacus]|uniref:Oxidoreductase n=1 Tax=Pseudotabrizicola alkalilacus TaxID=2305252 RepID=A0A411Z322_9RHOB|nr:ferric reductase-like transmembrane domain-containing protein [Pseudotabrizicola alkalilacus]RGP37463.1 oxidoreductase [Pseudotabrizicola alkalilacus]
MNAPDHPDPQAFVRTADRPLVVALRASLWLIAGLGIIALPFVLILLGSDRPTAVHPLWDFAMGCGFAALTLAIAQFALTGRVKLLTTPFGADIIYLFHRFLSWGVLGLMLTHFGILYIWYQPALGELNPLTARWELTAGRVALVCFGALILSSELRKRVGLEYHGWRILHIALAVTGTFAALAHVLGVGKYSAMAGSRTLWLGIALVWAAFLAWSRLLRPMVLARNPWRVTSNEAERGGVHTLTLRPEGQPLRAWKPGQFAWLTIGHAPWALREHPFTISTAPDRGPEVSFSIKPLGDDSERMAKTPPGTLAYVDGPFGTFSIDREATAEGFVMIAGGVGITPILSNLHALQSRDDPRPVILLYANSTLDEASFREELGAIAQDIDLTIVHVPEEAPEDWQGETGMIDKDLLARHLPDMTHDWPHMLCGPAPMLEAVSKGLTALGVPARRISSEIFDLV